MGRKGFIVAFGVLLGLAAPGCCPRDPALNTVKTAHGNTDWHIDTAEEFLTGHEMSGAATAANHCPDTWTKTHMHVGETNADVYYYDSGVFASGNDSDATKGIDQAMLFFYAGHGDPTHYNTLGNSAYLDKMRLGNCAAGSAGILRYFWQCSCEVFAHGPKTCTPATEEYACPGAFDGSHDSDAMRNVYERWGPVLAPSLRMACGSSTAAYCHETEANKIWDNYNNKGYDVADAFIDGLHRYSWNTPLCITTGAFLTGSTPLFDATFTTAPNASGDYYHIQYLSNFASTAPMLLLEIPELLPIFELEPQPLPDPYRQIQFKEEGAWKLSVQQIRGRGPAYKVNGLSGATYAFGERRYNEATKPLDERAYLEAATRVMDANGWVEKETLPPVGVRSLIDRAPRREMKEPDIQRFTKNVTVTYRRMLDVGDKKVAVLGEGGAISVQLNADGSLYNASKVWRKIKGVRATTKAKTYDQALKEAQQRLGDKERDAYRLADWNWGYQEEAGNVEQPEMKAAFHFNFMPKEPRQQIEYPPRIVKISAHLDK